MAKNLFQDYDLLARSGFFDPEYYLAGSPDVAALKIDPLLHYLEHGAQERRNPSIDFDTTHYLAQCQERGEHPENPLLHFLTVGASGGLEPKPNTRQESVTGSELKIAIDSPQLGRGTVSASVHGGLWINGWALARAGVDSIAISVDGQYLMPAQYGIQRADVEAAYPDWKDARHSGFSTVIPQAALPIGHHQITVSLRDRSGGNSKLEFPLHVEEGNEGAAPWSLRQKISPGEVDLHLRILEARSCRPAFCCILVLDQNGIDRARVTIASLHDQVYANWNLLILSRDGNQARRSVRHALVDGIDSPDITSKIVFESDPTRLSKKIVSGKDPAKTSFFTVLSAGDQLGCDAFLQLAIAIAENPGVDFLYADELRINPVSGQIAPFLKPQWSPDLLLSTNYIGRLWCARSNLLSRSKFSLSELLRSGEYGCILRLTEQAEAIAHIPAVLCQRADLRIDHERMEKSALKQAIARRGMSATVKPGCVPGTYRTQRRVSRRDLVTVIIPTRAEKALIETCLNSLRKITAYRNLETICIANIPRENPKSKQWLRANADQVIETTQPFNWSRYNNLAAAKAHGKYLLFLNDDIEIIETGWLDAMIEHAMRPEVGAVGPQLLYPNRIVQHAGIVLNDLGTGRHAFRHQDENDPGYFGLALTQRNVMCVTGACLLTSSETFERLGQFDECHRIVNNDIDYCLRVWRAGLRTIFTPYAKLIHHECASRSSLLDEYDFSKFAGDWGAVFTRGDPFFNPHLSRHHDQFTPELEPTQLHCVGGPYLRQDGIRRILVVKLDHIGDCIVAFPAVRQLKRLFPAAKICVLAGNSSKPIWQMETAVDEVIGFDFFNARSELGALTLPEAELRALRKRLVPYRFDMAVDLRKLPETRPILQYTGARYLAGFDHRGRFPWLDFALEWEGDQAIISKRAHISDDLLSLVDLIANACRPRPEAIRATPGSCGKIDSFDEPRLFSEPVVCIHPGAGSAIKQWPAGHFAQLVSLLIEEEAVNVVLIGSKEDEETVASVEKDVRQRDRVWNLAGRLSLADLPGLLARSALFVGNDSGPKHIAAALGIPTVGIHSGVVDVREWGPIGANAVALKRKMCCSPCYLRMAADCSRKVACLTGLAPGIVFGACQKLLLIGHGAADGRSECRTKKRDIIRGSPQSHNGSAST